jgi:hypothetical protein
MIKLIKILGATNNAPEIEERVIADDINYYEGQVYYLTRYGISRHTIQSEQDPKFYVTQGRKAGDGTSTVKGFLCTPDMIFETNSKLVGSVTIIEHLSIVPLGRDSEDYGYSYILEREDDSGYSAQVYDATETNNRKYLIRLAW